MFTHKRASPDEMLIMMNFEINWFPYMLYSKKRQSPITHEKNLHHVKIPPLRSSPCQVGQCVCWYEQNPSRGVRGVAQTRVRDVRTCRCMDGQTNAHTYVRRSANLNVHPHWGHKTGILWVTSASSSSAAAAATLSKLVSP